MNGRAEVNEPAPSMTPNGELPTRPGASGLRSPLRWSQGLLLLLLLAILIVPAGVVIGPSAASHVAFPRSSASDLATGSSDAAAAPPMPVAPAAHPSPSAPGAPSPIPTTASAPPAPSAAPPPSTSSPVASGSSTASEMLAQASASLSAGQGPAGGQAWNCPLGTSSSAGVACSAGTSNGLGPSPASGPHPSTNTIGTYPVAYLPNTPMPRESATMIYDTIDGYVVLYSGYGADQYTYSESAGDYGATDQGETWVFNSNTWTLLHPEIAPPARNAASMMYDTVYNRVIMFGGYTCGYFYCQGYNDTWAFRSGEWTDLTNALGAAPPARWHGQMAWNSTGGYGILFGGLSTNTGEPLRDLWYFNPYGAVWYNETATVTYYGIPPARYSAIFVFDGDLFGGYGAFVLSGGYGTNPHTGFNGGVRDTWLLSSWWDFTNVTSSETTSPVAMGQMDAAYNLDNGILYAAGGYNYSTGQRYNATWEISAVAGLPYAKWSICTACGKLPFNTSQGSMLFDPLDGEIELWGGDVNQSYQEVAGAPQVGVFWNSLMLRSYDGGAWSDAAYSNSPGNRSLAMMAYDQTDGVVVLFGGYAPNFNGCWPYYLIEWEYCGDTWTFSAGTWTVWGYGGPAPRAGGIMVFDPSLGELVLTGGFAKDCATCAATYYNDTWEFDVHSGWTELHAGAASCTHTAVNACAPAFQNATAVWDYRDGGLFLFGGRGWNPGTFSGAAQTLCYTYYYDGEWLNESPSTPCANAAAPGARSALVSYFSFWDSYVEIYGGLTAAGVPIDDGIWEWSVSTGWTGHCTADECTRVGPLYGATMTEEYNSDWWWLFGGRGSAPVVNGTYWNIVCESCGWSNAGPWGPSPARPLYGSSATDLADGYDVVFGGQAYPTATWIFDRYPPLAGDPGVSNNGPSYWESTIDLGQTVTFTPSSQQGTPPQYYLWQGLPPGCIAPNFNTSFTCTPTQAGTYGITLAVFQYNGVPADMSRPERLVVLDDPVLTLSTSRPVADVGMSVTLTAVGSLGYAPYQFAWQGLPNGVACPGTSDTCTFTAYSSDVGLYDFSATLVDSDGFEVASGLITFQINPDPSVSVPVLSRSILDVGQTLTLSTTPTGGTGTSTLSWGNLGAVGCFSSNAASVVCVPTKAATTIPSVTITDALAMTNTTNAALALVVESDPTLSGITSSHASLDLGSGSTLFAVVASGGSGPGTYTYVWSGLPVGCSAPGNVSSVTCAPTAAGTSTITVTATDANGFTVTSASFGFTTYPAPQAGSVSLGAASVDNGQTVQVSAAAPTGGSGGFTYTWNNLPTGCSGTTLSLTCSPAVGTASCFSVSITVTDSNGVSSTSAAAQICVYLDPTLTTPTATASALDVGQSTTLTATGTPGSGGDRYSWSGLPPGCSSASALTLTCTPTGPGTYTVTLTVVDSNGYYVTSGTLTLTVSSDPVVSAPAASPTSLDVGQKSTISVSASGGAGSLSYTWTGLPAGCTPGSVSSFSCTPAAGSAGVYFVTVTVKDGNSFSITSASVTLYVSPDPTITSLTASTVSMDVGQSLQLKAVGTSGSGSLTFTWSGLPTGCSGSAAWAITCVPTGAGTFGTIDLTVTDSNGGTATWSPTLSVTVYADPTISGIASSRSSMDVTQTADLSASATSPAGGPVYAWAGLPSGCTGTATLSVTCTPAAGAQGAYSITVTVTDGNGVSATSSSFLLIVSALPSIASIATSRSSADVGQSLVLTATGTSGSGGLTFTWSGLPLGCAAANAWVLTCAPTGAGTTVVGLSVTDSNGGTATFAPSLSLTIFADPTAGTATSSLPALDVGQSTTLTGHTTPGSGGDVLFWWGLPSGCLSANSATLTCVPTSAGTFWVLYSVLDSDAFNATSSALELVVSTAPTTPTLSASVTSLDVGSAVVLSAGTTGGASPDHWSWTGLPAGCVDVDAATITCTPSTWGTPSISATVTDANGVSATSAALVLDVAADPTVGAPTATASTLDVGQSTTLTVVSTVGTAWGTLTWWGLPAGCASANASTVTCTPTAAGTFLVGVTVMDANGQSRTGPATTLVVSPALTGASLTATPAALDAGATLLLAASVSGGAAPYAYSWSGLPTGCVGADVASASCVPTAAGTFSVEVKITDANGASTTATASVVVSAALSVSLVAVPTSATSGTSLTFTATATGGSGTLTYAWYLNGSLEAGSTGSTFSVADARTGTYAVQVVVSDGNGGVARSGTVTVTVTAPASTTSASAAPTPFGSSADYVLMAMLAIVILLGIVIVLLQLRNRGGRSSTSAPVPASRAPAPAPAPSSDEAAAPVSANVDYHET